MNIIFLDIDGVLNYSKCKEKAPSGCIGIDRDKLKLLRILVNNTNAKVVLISTWKSEWDKDASYLDLDCNTQYMVELFDSNGIDLIDKTYESSWSKRGQGILDWLSTHEVNNFIILDDECFDYAACGLLENHIKTNFHGPFGGLLEGHVLAAIHLLNK